MYYLKNNSTNYDIKKIKNDDDYHPHPHLIIKYYDISI